MTCKHTLYAGFLMAMLLVALGACGTAGAQAKAVVFDDALITERVTKAIHQDPTLRKMDISIRTEDGVVHLRGFVDSMAHVDRAGVLARRIDGVTSVRNRIRVANRPSRA